jgi:crotonobetainyl-CoA:carnitine CoA-transferase CaiB-like acyl-CoA transferase
VADAPPPLAGVRVLEVSLLEPAAVGPILADLGADVIKVETPGGGDYVRRMVWPMVDGVSLLHWHVNRGKRSIELDLRTDEGVELFLDLAAKSDVVIEAMRPGALARRGITVERLHGVRPDLVICSISGWGLTGPYANIPAHGIGFDAWAGLAEPGTDERGFVYMPDHTTVGVRVTPVWAAMAISAALVRAKTSGVGAHIDLAQADVAAITNWFKIEGMRAYERPEDEVTGNPVDGGDRRAPGIAGMLGSVRYQYYRTRDSYVLLMASEREFWQNFCDAVGRADLYEGRAGSQYADHARGDHDLQDQLTQIFLTRTTDEWVALGETANCPIARVNDATTITTDPGFRSRLPWLPAAEYGADLMPSPVNLVGERLAHTLPAPTSGQQTDDVLREVLGMSAQRLAELRESGVLGPPTTEKG